MLIIGSAKSGTTSLHHYLDEHPEISMASPRGNGPRHDNDAAGKEMRFFWREDWRARLDWYQSHFAEMPTPIRGEATPAYSAHPFHPGVAERIHSVIPQVRLLYIVRDPIDRILSHYVQQWVDGDRRSLDERMEEYDEPANSIVCPSRYATQAERYLSLFGESQLLVIDQHELKHRRRATLQRIFAFLGVEEGFWSPVFEQELNTRAEKYALSPLGERVLHGLLDPVCGRLMPTRWPQLRSTARRALSTEMTDRPVIEGDARRRLAAMLGPEVDRLRELSGERFESWSL